MCVSVSMELLSPLWTVFHKISRKSIDKFKVYGSVQRKYIPIYIQQDATLHSLFITRNCSAFFGWYLHPSSGMHTTVSTTSGICHAVTATCRYRARVGAGLSVLWVAWTTHSTLKPP